MLTTELRTMDMKEVIELWETDKKKLKIKLLDDYHMLVKEYRKQCKVYTQESSQGSKIFNKYKTFERINYQAELGIDKNLYGTVKFTEDFSTNVYHIYPYSNILHLKDTTQIIFKSYPKIYLY